MLSGFELYPRWVPLNEVNKIIFDFIWKGKDKVKRRVLVGDIEDGGLKLSLIHI